MKLSNALEIVMNETEDTHEHGEFYEAHRLMTGHLKQLKKREEGRKDTELTEVQVYQEFHHQNVGDIGVAFNENKVWVCLDGVTLFRAKAMGTQMLTEYFGRQDG